MFHKMLTIMANCFSGLYALLQLPAGWLSLLALTSVTYLSLKGHLGDVAFASVMSILPAVLTWTEHAKSMANSATAATASAAALVVNPIPPNPSPVLSELPPNLPQKGTL
jgi:hypothetical protein